MASSILSSFSRSPSIIRSTGTPVQRLTTAAMSSLGHFLAQQRIAAAPAASASWRSSSGMRL
jgi:hypothetical protein